MHNRFDAEPGLPKESAMSQSPASRWIARVAVCLSLLLFGLSALWAQSDRGTITGTVSDPAGAVVPAAALTLTNTGTAAVYDTVTTATGNYTLPSLPSGRYNLRV